MRAMFLVLVVLVASYASTTMAASTPSTPQLGPIALPPLSPPLAALISQPVLVRLRVPPDTPLFSASAASSSPSPASASPLSLPPLPLVPSPSDAVRALLVAHRRALQQLIAEVSPSAVVPSAITREWCVGARVCGYAGVFGKEVLQWLQDRTDVELIEPNVVLQSGPPPTPLGSPSAPAAASPFSPLSAPTQPSASSTVPSLASLSSLLASLPNTLPTSLPSLAPTTAKTAATTQPQSSVLPPSLTKTAAQAAAATSAPTTASSVKPASANTIIDQWYIAPLTAGSSTAGAATSPTTNTPTHTSTGQTTPTATKITRSTASWALDRIDQRNLPLDGRYTVAQSAGDGVEVYVLDSGVQVDHEQFEGRARWGLTAAEGAAPRDLIGHGTHVAGLVGARDYGVAPKTHLIAVKVFGDNGQGAVDVVISALDWALQQHTQRVQSGACRASIINLSMSGDLSSTLNAAITSIVHDYGVPVVVAAGNNKGQDACKYSPSAATGAISVGSTTSSDQLSQYSNVGTCVHVFAPGEDILSTTTTAKDGPITLYNETGLLTGTSAATPLVTGAISLLLGDPRSAPVSTSAADIRSWTSARVASLLADASSNVLRGLPSSTVNLLEYTGDDTVVVPPPTASSTAAAPPPWTSILTPPPPPPPLPSITGIAPPPFDSTGPNTALTIPGDSWTPVISPLPTGTTPWAAPSPLFCIPATNLCVQVLDPLAVFSLWKANGSPTISGLPLPLPPWLTNTA